MRCVTHHHACDCREHKVAVLLKAALDAAAELDALNTIAPINGEERERIQMVVARVYAAGEFDTPRKPTRKMAAPVEDEPLRQRISRPAPGVIVHRCMTR